MDSEWASDGAYLEPRLPSERELSNDGGRVDIAAFDKEGDVGEYLLKSSPVRTRLGLILVPTGEEENVDVEGSFVIVAEEVEGARGEREEGLVDW